MTGTAIAGIGGAVVGLWVWLTKDNDKVDRSVKALGLEPEHQRQIALGVTDLREHAHKPDLHLVDADGSDDEISDAVGRIFEFPDPDGGVA